MIALDFLIVTYKCIVKNVHTFTVRYYLTQPLKGAIRRLESNACNQDSSDFRNLD